MSLAVFVAVAEQDVEQRLVSAFTRPGSRLVVERRCVDVPDLLGAAAGRAAAAVLVSVSLRGLDRHSVARLHGTGLVVVGVAAGGDADVSDVGFDAVIDPATNVDLLAATVERLVLDRRSGRPVRDQPAPAALPCDVGSTPSYPLTPATTSGRVVAVWGPAGSPGRTVVVTSLAAELVLAGASVLVIDADVYAASVAQSLGILDEIPGVAAACRLANAGELDLARLAGVARSVGLRGRARTAPLRVLTGLPRADRWPELRPSSISTVLALARGLADVTLVDCSACLEEDEDVSYDVPVPRRNGATLTVLRDADEVLVVGRADPVGITRLVRGLDELGRHRSTAAVRIVLNRSRKSAFAGDPIREAGAVLSRFAGRSSIVHLPEDASAVDGAIARGGFVADVAAGSPFRLAVQGLAAVLLGRPAVAGRRLLGHRAAGRRSSR